MVIMNDLEWPMLSYYVTYYEKFKNVTQGIEKVALTTSHALRAFISLQNTNTNFKLICI